MSVGAAPVGTEGLGREVLITSARTGRGIGALASVLRDKISVMVGPLGAEKSYLPNALEPGLDVAKGDVGSTTHKDRHTIRVSQHVPSSFGGYVLDTAGVSERELWEIPPEELAACFREMRPLLGRCRFPDCAHMSEPVCPVRDAAAGAA